MAHGVCNPSDKEIPGMITIDGTDFTERLINQRSVVSADINEVFGTLAKSKTYALTDNDDYFNPFAGEGYFAQNNFRGKEVVEVDDSGITRFLGTIRAVQETDDQICVVNASEPLTIFLDWPVDASDRTTHAGFLVDGAVTDGQTIDIDGGATTIPIGAVVYFNGSKVPSYIVTSVTPTSGATTSITIDRSLEVALDDNSAVTVAVPATITGPMALKNALTTSTPGILLDGTFDILDASDSDLGLEVIINVMEQDNVPLREYIPAICEMCDLVLTQKNDGYYTVRRGLEWDRENITDELTADELCGPIEPDHDDSKLIIGYDLLYKSGDNTAAFLRADIDPELVRKYTGIKYWQPLKPAATFSEIRYMYASIGAAEYFGNRRLGYYGEVKTVINCTAKPSYSDAPENPLDLYLGKQVRATVRTFTDVPAIVVGYEYDDEALKYTKVRLQLNDKILFTPPAAEYMLTEGGNNMITETGNLMVKE